MPSVGAPGPRRAGRWAWRWSAASLVSQTLTLFVTPIFYIYMEHLQDWLARRKAARQPVPGRLDATIDGVERQA